MQIITRLIAALAACAALSVSVPVASADTVGEPCSDWMKISNDSSTGLWMVCGSTGGRKATWQPGDGSPAFLEKNPVVGPAGSPCTNLPLFTTGLSSDGYFVWCLAAGEQVSLPGGRTLTNPSTPLWSVYRP